VLIARRGPQSWDPGNAAGFQEWGNLVHEALSHVRSREDLGPVIEAMCVAGYLDETSSAKLERQLLAVLDHPEVGRYFTPETVIKSEAGILMPDGMVIRPDRVILSGDEVIILEYKTGLPREDHAMQVIKYASALLEMGYTRIRKLLVYVDDVVEVTELT
jgi:ATP-dependent exoDNAse (exonuclease V) beta subunit